MGRMGLPVYFISEYGADDVGTIIDAFLKENGVDPSYVYRHADGNTSLALAFLNEKNDAKYTFYKPFPEKRLDITFPVVEKDDIFQCGSFYAIWPEIRSKFMAFMTAAYENGAFILYDPNFRPTHAAELDRLRPLVIENMKMTTLLRGSDEDFKNLFDVKNVDEAWEVVKQYTGALVYTANAEGVFVRTNSFSGKFPVHKIVPVSTIGAGDNFNAGMLTAIYNNKLTGADMPLIGEDLWKKIISSGVEFATHVCMSYDNYISEEFAGELKGK